LKHTFDDVLCLEKSKAGTDDKSCCDPMFSDDKKRNIVEFVDQTIN